MENNLSIVATFSDITQAHIIKGKLESYGIDAFFQDEKVNQVDWLIPNSNGLIKLCVKEIDLPRAREALADTSELESETCPNCQSETIRYRKINPFWKIISLLFLVVVPRNNRKRYLCLNCEHKW